MLLDGYLVLGMVVGVYCRRFGLVGVGVMPKAKRRGITGRACLGKSWPGSQEDPTECPLRSRVEVLRWLPGTAASEALAGPDSGIRPLSCTHRVPPREVCLPCVHTSRLEHPIDRRPPHNAICASDITPGPRLIPRHPLITKRCRGSRDASRGRARLPTRLPPQGRNGVPVMRGVAINHTE